MVRCAAIIRDSSHLAIYSAIESDYHQKNNKHIER